jgi:hypothetical protein
MFKVGARVGGSISPECNIALASIISGIFIANWLAPIGLRLQWRRFDAPVLFLSLLLLSWVTYSATRSIRSRSVRYLVRGLSVLVCVFAIPPGIAGFVWPVSAEPVAVTSVGADQIVASLMAGGAVGPHYTEFRQQRSVLPGLVLTRYIGSSDHIGDVTLSFVPPHTLHAVVRPFNLSNAPTVIELSVSPLPPQWAALRPSNNRSSGRDE